MRTAIRQPEQTPWERAKMEQIVSADIAAFGQRFQVAEEIVDRFETVEIGDADCEGSRVAGALGRDLQDLVPHAIAVSQSGERIGIGHRLKLILTHGQESYLRRFHHANPSFSRSHAKE